MHACIPGQATAAVAVTPPAAEPRGLLWWLQGALQNASAGAATAAAEPNGLLLLSQAQTAAAAAHVGAATAVALQEQLDSLPAQLRP